VGQIIKGTNEVVAWLIVNILIGFLDMEVPGGDHLEHQSQREQRKQSSGLHNSNKICMYVF